MCDVAQSALRGDLWTNMKDIRDEHGIKLGAAPKLCTENMIVARLCSIIYSGIVL